MFSLCFILFFFNIVNCDMLRNPPQLMENYDPRFGSPDSEPRSYLAHGLEPRSRSQSSGTGNDPQSYFPRGVPLGSPGDVQNPDFNEYSRAEPYELYDLEAKLTRTGKWPEFLQKLKEQGDKVEPGQVMPNWQQDVYKWAAYAKHLDEPTISTTTLKVTGSLPVTMDAEKPPKRQPLLRIAEPRGKPSLGLEMYWSGETNENQQRDDTQRRLPYDGRSQMVSGPNMMDIALKKIEYKEDEVNEALRNAAPNVPPPGFTFPSEDYPPNPSEVSPPTLPPPKPPQLEPQNNDLMRMMLIKIQNLERQIKEQSKTESPKFLPGFPTERQRNLKRENASLSENQAFKNFPAVDDFNSPIRWVRLTSNETEDGLARVTDPETGKNKQYMVNSVFYVPITDYRAERIGLTTSTTLAPLFTTEKNILRMVMKSVDLRNPDEKDWLAIEVLMGGDRREMTCDGEKCQARCRTMGCESMCEGDGCASGCIGSACTSYCRGPGCLSMCIGERCSAKCDGLSCDSRCRGKNCEANCHKFSCYKTVNGVFSRGSGAFDQWYPQDDS